MLVRQHAVGVARYLGDGRLSPAFNLTTHERDQLWAAGLSIGLVWEREAKRMDGGFLAGHRDAKVANDQADALGFPQDRPIHFANDQNVQYDDRHFAYMAGAQHASKRPVGAYGSAAFLEGCRTGLDVRYLWKVSTWGPRLDGLTLEQMANIPPPIPRTDVNHVRADDWGQWIPTPEEPAMPTGQDLLDSALKFRGQRYSTNPGRTDPSTSWKDCSGLVFAAFLGVGITPGGTVSTSLETWAVNNGGRYLTRDEALVTPGAGLAIWGFGPQGHIGFSVGDGARAFETPSDEGRKVGYSRFDRNRWTRFFTWPGIDHHGTPHIEEDDDMGFLAHMHFDERVWYCRATARTALNTRQADLDLNVLAQLAEAGAVPNPVDIRLIGPATLALYDEKPWGPMPGARVGGG